MCSSNMVHLQVALFFIGALFFSLNFLCCMEPAAEVLLELIKSAVIRRSLLISLEHPGQPSLRLQERRVEFSYQRSGMSLGTWQHWRVRMKPVGWVWQSCAISMSLLSMNNQN